MRFSCSPLLMVTPAHGLEVSETLSLKPTARRCPSKMQHNICSILLLAHMAREQSHSPPLRLSECQYVARHAHLIQHLCLTLNLPQLN